jgi:uncharacterized protein
MRAGLAILILLFAVGVAGAVETPIPPAPTSWVTDRAGFMSAPAARSLDTQLEAYQRSTGHQLLVYIGRTTGDAPIEDWAVRAFAAWKVGRKGIDDGLVLFIMADDRKVHIEVGYGLEPLVTDAISSRVIRDIITPRIQSGDKDGAVTAGMDALVRAIGGSGLSTQPAAATSPAPATSPAAPASHGPKPMPLWELILLGIAGVFLLILLITHPELAIYLLISILSEGSGGGSGGGGSGGGGFSGGGGRSGGGGASGSW